MPGRAPTPRPRLRPRPRRAGARPRRARAAARPRRPRRGRQPQTAEKSFNDRILDALNAARAVPRTCGTVAYPAAGPLRWQVQAEQAALVQAQYLQQNNLFTHTGAGGSSVGDRLSATGYVWQAVGENLAAGYTDFATVLQGWIASPGHCVNVMNGNYVDVGVVLVQGTSSNTYRTYWAMVSGKPR